MKNAYNLSLSYLDLPPILKHAVTTQDGMQNLDWSKANIWRKLKEWTVSSPTKYGPTSVRWSVSDVHEYGFSK